MTIKVDAISQTPPKKPSAWEVANEYIRKPKGMRNLIIKPALTTINWMHWYCAEFNETIKNSKKLLKRVNKIFSWFDFPTQCNNLGKSLVRLKKSLSSGTFLEVPFRANKVFIDSALMVSLFSDTIGMCHKDHFISLSTSQLAVVSTAGFLGSVALFMNTIVGLKKQIGKFLYSPIGSAEFHLSLLQIVSKTCLVVITFFGMITFLLGSVISQVIFLLISTLLLVFSLSSYFYEKMYVEKKKKSIEV